MSRRSARGPGSLSPVQRRLIDQYLRRRGRQEFAMQPVSRPSFIVRWGPAILVCLIVAFLALPALAQPPTPPLALPATVEELIQALLVRGVLGTIIVVGTVALARLFAPGVLAPTPSTNRSVLANRLLALGAGFAYAGAGFGPVAALLATDELLAVVMVRIFDGVLVGALAMVGRDLFTDTSRVGREFFAGPGDAS